MSIIRKPRSSTFWSYGVAIVGPLLAFALTIWLGEVMARSIFAFFIIAVALSAYRGGWGSGLLAMALGIALTSYSLLPPVSSFMLDERSLPQLGVFVLVSVVICGLGAARLRENRNALESQERLQTTLRSIGDAVIATDSQGLVTFMNHVAQELTGWGEEAVGRRLDEVFSIINEDSRQKVDSPVKKVLHDGSIVGLANHTILIGRDGREVAIDDSAAPIRDASGEIAGVVLVFRDITDRRESERERSMILAELRQQRQRLEDLFASVPGVVWEAWGEPDKASQRIDYVSKYVETMLGYTQEEWLSIPNFWYTIVHPDDKERAGAEAAAIFRSCTIGDSQFRWIAKDGRTVWVDARSVVMLDDMGNPIGMRGVTMDASARKQAEGELNRAKESAEAASRAKDQFLAVLSHELRTPLTPVLAIAQMLEAEETLPEEIHSLLEIVRKNIELEVGLIDDLLDLVRVERGKMQILPEPTDLHLIVRNAVEICRREIEEKGLGLKVRLDAAESTVQADSARMQQVFWNLIGNAIKFTPSGEIEVHSTNREGSIIVEVRDTGIGIEPESLSRIFDAFEQGEQAVTRRFGGLGLGLSISRELVKMHGGELIASSDGKDKGASFRVELETVTYRKDDVGLAPAATAIYNGEAKSLHILLVDDHADTKDVIRLLLERNGYRVTTAGTVQGALALASQEQFDLLVSDIGLPDGNGYQLMRSICAIRPIKGIALSGFGMESDMEESRAAGFSDHLTKPVSFNRLQESIRRVTSSDSVTS